VLERWQGGEDAPPLHVNDSAAERHSHRIVSGSQVAKEMETLLFGSFAGGAGAEGAPGAPKDNVDGTHMPHCCTTA
jgi:hypothetical protein